MYCNFFGFSEKPFEVTADPRFLFLSPGHKESLSALAYGISERRGLLAILGDVGTGKTTLLKAVVGQLDDRIKVAYLFHTNLSFDQILHMALVQLGLAETGETLSQVESVHRLGEFALQQLTRGGSLALMIDEAQNLGISDMENFRLLSNLETRKRKLIQILFCGQLELDRKLLKPELKQLAQRISLRRYVSPLTQQETSQYVGHRLLAVGYSGPTLFTSGAQDLIWEYSAGVPRKINIICDNALMMAFEQGRRPIAADLMEDAIEAVTPASRRRSTPVADPISPEVNGPEARATASRSSPGSVRGSRMRAEMAALRATMDVNFKKLLRCRPLSGIRSVMGRIACPPGSRPATEQGLIEGYEELRTNLLVGHPGVQSILFSAVSPGAGCSTTAVNFAIALSRDSQRKVLFIDANSRNPYASNLLKTAGIGGSPASLPKPPQGAFPVARVGAGNLGLLLLQQYRAGPCRLFESKQFGEALKAAKERFDYIILDAPPVVAFPESSLLSAKVDGVVLVIEAGSTRWHVALAAKKKLEDAGGRVLGVVLSRRRYYIPPWVYRRL